MANLTKNQNLGLTITCIVLGLIVLGLGIATVVLCYQQRPEIGKTFSTGMNKNHSNNNSTNYEIPMSSPCPYSASVSDNTSSNAFQSQPGAPAMSDQFCMAKLTGQSEMGEVGSVCSVAQNNVCVPGVVTASGGCQTTVQQSAWQNWGGHMPNTYLISTSGPKIGATMGSCDVRGIGSSIQNHVGFFPSCGPTAPTPVWGRENTSEFAQSPNYSSCG
jgi:hypothetical protein